MTQRIDIDDTHKQFVRDNEPGQRAPTLRDHVSDLKAGGMRCNCNLDCWKPEGSTGHSWVCRIHKAAIAKVKAGASS